MVHSSWPEFVEGLRRDYPRGFFASTKDLERFRAFVQSIPPAERIPVLLRVYDRYRGCAVAADPGGDESFERSCYSILISTILSAGIQPDPSEACAILANSHHFCGHGADVDPPLDLAERAFRNQPYSAALFEAAFSYRENLRGLRSTVANNVKVKLNRVLWHDPLRVEKNCYTRTIQQAIHAMKPPEQFQWQWLLRNAAPGLNYAPGKAWAKEGQKRLAVIGAHRFHSNLSSWLTAVPAPVPLSAAGSYMLRLLVWYGVLADAERNLPVLMRLVHLGWHKRAPIEKVMGALAWAVRTYGVSNFAPEVEIICTKWAADSAEVRRLEEMCFPGKSRVRKEAEAALRLKAQEELSARLEAQRKEMWEKFPQLRAIAERFSPEARAAALARLNPDQERSPS